ncbi:MAG: hypothetical protein LUQ42_03710 [Methanomicrobiales archaeon]|jgi:Zn finger protein HypA/HybF involved in hydrogenase expression|nr:hypothetical protein [Methanomicrobiales archaeon]MDD1645822.1 hypothetical protein [Methanomicrobiales archaeon]MDD1647249.1 hypothetical protein [Methanomicrobiales archaeon]MDD1648370.1 hypothetical protein [Methanomicrobiales archaeon]
MTQKRRVEIRCSGCGVWFPYSRVPVHFADWDEWEPIRRKHRVSCPTCGKDTVVTKKAVREKPAN